jgi:hypothetical protein
MPEGDPDLMDLKYPLRVLVTTVILGAAACSAEPVAQPPAPPAQTATPSPTAASAIDGKWVSHLTRDDVARQIEKAGLAKWTKQFLVRERIRANNTAVYNCADGRFQVAYFDEGGVWHVGWAGPYVVNGNEVQMTDEATGITDVYTLRIVENRLDLDRVRSDAGTVNGFPFEVYDAAYLSDWWSHSDCAMETGKDC